MASLGHNELIFINIQQITQGGYNPWGWDFSSLKVWYLLCLSHLSPTSFDSNLENYIIKNDLLQMATFESSSVFFIIISMETFDSTFNMSFYFSSLINIMFFFVLCMWKSVPQLEVLCMKIENTPRPLHTVLAPVDRYKFTLLSVFTDIMSHSYFPPNLAADPHGAGIWGHDYKWWLSGLWGLPV